MNSTPKDAPRRVSPARRHNDATKIFLLTLVRTPGEDDDDDADGALDPAVFGEAAPDKGGWGLRMIPISVSQSNQYEPFRME